MGLTLLRNVNSYVMEMGNVTPTSTISLLLGKSKYFTRKGGEVPYEGCGE